MTDRTHRELTDTDIARSPARLPRLARRSRRGRYVDIPGFCKSAKLDEIRGHVTS